MDAGSAASIQQDHVGRDGDVERGARHVGAGGDPISTTPLWRGISRPAWSTRTRCGTGPPGEEPFWYRRCALVATTALNESLHGPTQKRLRRIGRVPPVGESPRSELTFELLDASLHDTRHFIRLGIGWALRPLSAVDPDGVAAWVTRNRAQLTKAMLNKARLDEDGQSTK